MQRTSRLLQIHRWFLEKREEQPLVGEEHQLGVVASDDFEALLFDVEDVEEAALEDEITETVEIVARHEEHLQALLVGFEFRAVELFVEDHLHPDAVLVVIFVDPLVFTPLPYRPFALFAKAFAVLLFDEEIEVVPGLFVLVDAETKRIVAARRRAVAVNRAPLDGDEAALALCTELELQERQLRLLLNHRLGVLRDELGGGEAEALFHPQNIVGSKHNIEIAATGIEAGEAAMAVEAELALAGEAGLRVEFYAEFAENVLHRLCWFVRPLFPDGNREKQRNVRYKLLQKLSGWVIMTGFRGRRIVLPLLRKALQGR